MSGRIVALVPDLMDRSRLAGRGVRVVDAAALAAEATGSDLVVVDLARPGALEAVAPLAAAGHRVVGFAPHVDVGLRDAAAAAGVEVLARSRFFGNLDEVLGPPR